jgi:hypothetical protein
VLDDAAAGLEAELLVERAALVGGDEAPFARGDAGHRLVHQGAAEAAAAHGAVDDDHIGGGDGAEGGGERGSDHAVVLQRRHAAAEAQGQRPVLGAVGPAALARQGAGGLQMLGLEVGEGERGGHRPLRTVETARKIYVRTY